MNPDRERALVELARRNPFWVSLLVFGLLATDGGFRLTDAVRQRRQLDAAQLGQARNIGRLRDLLNQAPQVEAKLQALSLDLLELAKTNASAAQIVRDFNIQWTPGPESFLTPPALPPALPATAATLATPPAAKQAAPPVTAPKTSPARTTNLTHAPAAK